ncbi:MAG: TonB-dependent receptor [Ferruginibacter sp.]
MNKFCFLILLTMNVFSASAQKNGTIRGVVIDNLSRQTLAYVTVTLMEAKDSSLVSFSMTDDNGRFEFKNIHNGNYRLMISRVGYHNSNSLVSITDEQKLADLGNLLMLDISKTLNEVVVKSDAPPVTLLGDTIQYNAGSFKTVPNANVQDLLKKLPGIKVEKDGTVKAQGEKVNRVLVDGKEFFGNDPKVATQNLPADAVDKVQVYDRQSDQAQLTGFEDGNYEKTINLKLKKDKKKGMFGKINAGAGTDDRYESKFNINSFKGARQASAIGMANNANAEGFSFMDILNFTGELGRMQRNGGGSINISSDDAASMGVGGGSNTVIRTAWAGGFNYNNIIGIKTDLQSNYFYNHYNPKTESQVQRQYFLPDSSYYYNQHSITNNLNDNHRLNANVLYQIDSFNSIRVTPSFSFQKTNNSSSNDYRTNTEDGSLTNQGFSNNSLSNEGYNFRNEIMYRHKMQRKGRTLSLSLQSSNNKSNGESALSSINEFYNSGGSLLARDTLNQQSNLSALLTGVTGRVVYTEPFLKRSLLEFSAGKSYTKNVSEKTTYDYDAQNGKYNQFNEGLSNDFENIYSFTNVGLRMRTQKKKYNFTFGATWQEATLEGKITSGLKDSVISKNFQNLLPNARFQYNFSRYKNFSISYGTNTTQPDMSQLQPVPDNSNALNIKVGNPELKQEFTHSFRTNLNLVSIFSSRNLFFNLSAQTTQNKIVNYDSISSLGVKTTMPVNVNGVYNVNGNASYSFPVRSLKLNADISSRVGYYSGKQFVNKNPNVIKALVFGPEIRLDINPNKNLDLGITAAWNYNKTKYSLRELANTTYLQQEYGTSIDWQVPKKFFLSTDFTYTINSQRAAGFNNKVPIWNASISRQVLKLNRGEVKIKAMDLLDKNIGINRSSNQNYIEDSRVKTLRRFFMLSFTYSLNKRGLNNDDGGNVRMMSR